MQYSVVWGENHSFPVKNSQSEKCVWGWQTRLFYVEGRDVVVLNILKWCNCMDLFPPMRALWVMEGCEEEGPEGSGGATPGSESSDEEPDFSWLRPRVEGKTREEGGTQKMWCSDREKERKKETLVGWKWSRKCKGSCTNDQENDMLGSRESLASRKKLDTWLGTPVQYSGIQYKSCNTFCFMMCFAAI